MRGSGVRIEFEGSLEFLFGLRCLTLRRIGLPQQHMDGCRIRMRLEQLSKNILGFLVMMGTRQRATQSQENFRVVRGASASLLEEPDGLVVITQFEVGEPQIFLG